MKQTIPYEPALDKIGHPRQRAFLAVYAESGNVRRSARAADIPRSLHYYWRDTNPDYARAFDEATRQAIDLLESEAMRRAVEGVERLALHGGKPIRDPRTGEWILERKFSDALLIKMLEAAAPEKYRANHAPPVEDDGVRIAGRSREEVIREEIAARQNALDMLKESGGSDN